MNPHDACQEYCIHSDLLEQVRSRQPQEETIVQLANTFKAMGDPTRLKIIGALTEVELCVCDISALLDMTQSAISHQLRVLRSLNLVKYRREGKQVYYSLNDDHIINLYGQGLEHVLEGVDNSK